MALVLKDRVKETSSTSGTGTLTLAGAVSGFQAFSAVGDGNTTYYAVSDPATGDWEVGLGTYTASGTTLARTTVLSSSNADALVNFAAGSKDVFVTYPSEKGVWLDATGTANATLFGAITATSAALTTGTVSTTPAADTDIANKLYVDNLVASGIHFHAPVRLEHVGNLPGTYNNGSSGVGATLTNNTTQVVLTADGVEVNNNDRIIFYEQTDATQNGVYVVTDKGSISTNWVLTRSTDADTYGLTSPNTLGEGSTFFVQQGDTAAGETYTCNTVGTITFGTTDINFAQISSAQIYSAGTGLTLAGTQFSITNTAVTAATYGSASVVPVFAVNAQGQLTGVTNTTIAIAGSQVSGAITGQAGSVANALTLGTYLTGGSFNGSAPITATVDATSANTASKVVARDASGNFAAGTITAALSGNATTATTATNVAGGAANQIVYNTTSGTSAFAAAPSASGQVLGWNGAAFAWTTTIATATSAATATTATNQSGGTVDATTIVASTSILPATDNTGVVGDTANTWSNGQFADLTVNSVLTVRTAIDLSDNDVLRFGAADDTRLFYDGTNNTMQMELEAAAVSFIITDNGTTRFTFTKATGDLEATSFTGSLSGNATTATTATNIAGGAASQIPYQTGSGATSFIANGTSGQVLTSNGASAPSWETSTAASKSYVQAMNIVFGL